MCQMTLFVCVSWCACVSVREREHREPAGWSDEWPRNYEERFNSLKKSINHYVMQCYLSLKFWEYHTEATQFVHSNQLYFD